MVIFGVYIDGSRRGNGLNVSKKASKGGRGVKSGINGDDREEKGKYCILYICFFFFGEVVVVYLMYIIEESDVDMISDGMKYLYIMFYLIELIIKLDFFMVYTFVICNIKP